MLSISLIHLNSINDLHEYHDVVVKDFLES